VISGLNPPPDLNARPLPISQIGGELTGIRIYRATFPTGLGTGPGLSRLSHPRGYGGPPYSVLYLAEDLQTALMEAIFRDSLTGPFANRLADKSLLIRFVKSKLRFDFSGWELLDLTGAGPTKIGMHRDVMNSSDQTYSREWSAEIHNRLPKVGAIAYNSTFTRQRCLALYDRAIGKGTELERTYLHNEPNIYDALDQLNVGLTK